MKVAGAFGEGEIQGTIWQIGIDMISILDNRPVWATSRGAPVKKLFSANNLQSPERALTLDSRRPASRYTFSCSAVIVDPPQSAEIERFDVEDLAAAAAAMSIVRPDVEALALEAALERLGAMASVRSMLRAGKK